MMKLLLFFTTVLFCMPGFAVSNSNLLAIGQGISSPAITSIINYTNGYTKENPTGVAYQNSLRVSGHMDFGDHDDNSSTDDVDGFGAELGVGNGKYGMAVGYYDRDCNNCEESIAGALGAFLGGFGIGLRFEEEIYSAGLMFNPMGTHRLGVAADLNDPEGDDNNITSFGLGYSYVSDGFTFTVDASKRDYESDTATNKDVVMLSPGLSVRVDMFALMVTHDTFLNEDDGREIDDNTWWGLGVGRDGQWHVAVYNDFVNEWTLAGTLFF